MRRLLPVLIAVLALAGAPRVGAAQPQPRLVVVKGSARAVDGRLKGWFVVANRGTAASRATTATVSVAVGEPPSRVLIHWTLRRAKIPSLDPSQTRRVLISVPIPGKFGAEWSPIRACVARSCRVIGHLSVLSEWQRRPPSATPVTVAAQSSTSAPVSTVPTDPIAHPTNEPFAVSDGAVRYYGFVPSSYDESNQRRRRCSSGCTVVTAKPKATRGSSTPVPKGRRRTG